MKKNIGLWIDHEKAVLVIQDEQKEDIQKIESGVGGHVPYRGASTTRSPYSTQYQKGDNRLDNKFNEQLNKFYKKVIAQISSAEAVLIIGPGEAKKELEKRIAHEKVKVQIAGIEIAGKLTDRQLASKVRKFFQ